MSDKDDFLESIFGAPPPDPSAPEGGGGQVITDADPLAVNLTGLYGEQQDINPALVGSMLQNSGVPPAGMSMKDLFLAGPIPPTVPRQEEISAELAQAFEIIDQNIFNREALLRNLNSFATLPEIAHLLRTPGAIEELQGDYYSNTLSWFNEQVGQEFSVESSQRQIAGVRTVDRFFSTHGDTLQTEERDLLMSIWSAIPWGSDFIRNAAINGEDPTRPFDSGGFLAPLGNLLGGQFRAGFRQINAAPQDVQNLINDPREQVAALALEYLNENPLETLEDRQKFIVKNYEWVAMKRSEHRGSSSGIGRLGERLALPFRVISNDLATLAAAGPMDSVQAIFGNAKGPDEFAWRQHMSFGQNVALSMGANPGSDAGTSFLSDGILDTITSPVEKVPFVGTFLTDLKQYGNSFELSSGLFDMMLNLSPADPLNLIPNISSGFTKAAKVARADDMSRAQAAFQALRPFSGRSARNSSAGRVANLPVMGRGTTARFTWALMSRTIDDLVEETSSIRAATWIAKQSNRARIVERFPTLQNATLMVDQMAKTTDPGQITDLIRAGMKGGDIGLDAPLMVSRTAALLEEATDTFKKATQEALDSGELGLGQLSAINNVSEADGVWVRSLGVDLDALARGTTSPALAARVIEGANEGVLEGVVRNGARVVSQGENILSETLADGRVIDFFARGQDVVARVGDVVVGGLLASRKEVAVAADFGFKNATLASGKGIATTLVDLAEQVQPGALRGLAESSSISEQGLEFLRREATTRLGSGAIEPGVVMRASELSADGGTKALVSRLNTPFRWLDLGADPTSHQKAIAWLTEKLDEFPPAEGLIAKLADMPPGNAASVLDSLDPQEMELLMRFVKVSGASAVRHGNGAVFTNRGARALVTGSDLADEASGVFEDVLLGPAHSLAVAQGAAANLKAGTTPTLWSIADLPRMSKARGILDKAPIFNRASRVTAFHRALRRAGAQFRFRAPGNISLTRGGEGASQLNDWIRLLGGTREIAAKWVDEFMAANPANRNRVVLAAMQEVGEEIEHPLLSMGLLSFTNKQGHFTYFFDSAGQEIGLARGADGGTTIKPLSISHFAKDIAMPDASEMLSSIRRFRSTKRGPARIGAVRRGVFGSTKQDRKALAQTYRSQLMRKTGEPVGLADEDLLAIAYSDVMGVGQYGRSNGLGYVHQMARMATKPLRMFHNAFSIAQLAGRAIPWSSRISLEESVRAGFVGLPTVWRNPKTYLNTFWDAHVIRAMPKQLSRQAQEVNSIVMDIFDIGIRSHDEIMAGVHDLIPDIARLADEADVSLDDLGRVRALVGHHLGRELIGGNANDLNMIGSRTNAARRTLLRNRSLRNRFARLENKGFEKGFTFEMDAPDILNRSIFSTFNTEVGAATLPIEWKPGAMSAGMVNNYGRGYGRQLHQLLGDPVNSRWGIGRALARARGGESSLFSVESFAKSKWWQDLKPNAVDAALYRGGIDVGDDLALATWFLDDVVDEMVDTLLSPFWIDSTGAIDLARKEEVLQGLVSGGTLNGQMGGRAFHVTRTADNYETFVATVQDFTQAAYQNNVALPKTISAYFDPRMGQIGADKPFYRRLTDQVMQFAGEDVTQKLHRQPAFVHTFSEYFDHYKRLGWGDEAARGMANEKAVETVNYVFFNNSNTTMFMKKMNNVIPFFSAWWEVLSTWAIKIPSQDFFPMGHASLFRRVDRFMDGLVNTGIIDIDEEGQYSLNLQEDLGESTAFGHALSKMGHSMVKTPATVVSHLAALGQLAGDAVNGDGFSFDSYQPKDMSAIAKDGFKIQIGSPVDPFTHGVMAVNQLGFGFFPETSFIASKLLAKASFAGDVQLFDTTEDTNAIELAANMETDFGTLLARNADAFEQAWGKETLARVRNGTIDPDTLTIPAGITFQIPDSSVMSRLINEVFFPFGQLHTGSETITQITPSTIGYIMRGLGVLIDDDDPSGNFLTGVFGSTGQFQVDSEIISQIQHLEATEGLVTKALELATELNTLVEQAVESPDGPLQVSGLEEGLPVLLNPDHPLAEEYRTLVEQMSEANTQIVKRASDNAGWALIIRGLTGSFGPSTPRMFFEEQQQAGQHWASRNLAEESKVRGSFNFAGLMDETRINGFEDLNRTLELTGRWLDDPTGDQAKAFLKKSYPSLLAFTQGKAFWGPGGPPPETKGIEGFFEQVESGERPVYPPDVFVQKLARASVAIDREVAIINQYGNDQAQQAVQVLNDWSAYKDLTEDFDRQYEALDWWDEEMNDGGYRDWVDRNPTDRLTLYETLKRRFNRAIDNVDDVLNAVDFLSITPDERRQIAGILKSSTRGIADIIQEFDAYSQDETFDNQRERLIGNYFTNVADPFYTQRTDFYDQIARAETKEERSILFDKIRDLENQQWVSSPQLDDGSGQLFPVPNELVRVWNGKSDEDKINRKLRWVAQKPEWMSLQAAQTLVLDNSDFTQFVPTTPSQMKIYSDFAETKRQIIEFARANPEDISEYERDKAISELQDSLERQLVEGGRGAEVVFARAWPIQRLAYAGKLPPVLKPVLEGVNSIRQALDAAEKGPTSNEGRKMFLALTDWLEQEFYPSTPGAMEAIDQLGLVMFDEPLRSTVYAKLLYGDYFGTLD